jgi:hypothetical protein
MNKDARIHAVNTIVTAAIEDLGAMLPDHIMGGALRQTKYHLTMGKVHNRVAWFIRYTNDDLDDTYHVEFGRNEAESRMAMLVWLNDNGFIKIGDNNVRR